MTHPRTLLANLAEIAKKQPSSYALIDDSNPWTYEILLGSIAEGGLRLLKAGVKNGDRVVIISTNTGLAIAAHLAIQSIGAIAIPISKSIGSTTLNRLITLSSPSLVLAPNSYNCAGFRVIQLRKIINTNSRVPKNWSPSCESGDISEILFTSGTSADPKGVVLTHGNALAVAETICKRVPVLPSHKELLTVPVSHSFGLGRLRSMCLIGHCLVLHRGLLNPFSVLETVSKLGLQGLAITPSGIEILRRVSSARHEKWAHSLRYIELGSAPLGNESRRWLNSVAPNACLMQHYGLTEASRSLFSDLRSHGAAHSVLGYPSPGVEIRLTNDKGTEILNGSTGQISIRGATVMKEYWKDEKATELAFRGSWFQTGDLARQREDGAFEFVGRTSDSINVGGTLISPSLIESILCDFPEVSDVGCIGVPDRYQLTGEAVVLFVQTRNRNLEQRGLKIKFRDHLRSKLGNHAVPQTLQFVENIPRNASGKIDRRILRIWARKLSSSAID